MKRKILKDLVDSLNSNFNTTMELSAKANSISKEEFYKSYDMTAALTTAICTFYVDARWYIVHKHYEYSESILVLMDKVRFYAQYLSPTLPSVKKAFDLRKQYMVAKDAHGLTG